MDEGRFDDRLWTLEQALIWMLTHDQELVVQNSGETLTALVEWSRLAWNNHESPQTPLAQYLDEHPQARGPYREHMRELLSKLKDGALSACGEPKSTGIRVKIGPLHWADYTIAPGPDGLLSDRRRDNRLSPDTGLYRRIRLERTEVLRSWPQASLHGAEQLTAQKRNASKKKRAVEYFVQLIAADRDYPIRKERMIEMAQKEIPGLSYSMARDARAAAIRKISAKNWSRPGRPRKNRSDEIDNKQS